MEKEFDKLKHMEFSAPSTKGAIKYPLLRAKVSSRLSIFFILAPLLFLGGVIFKHYMQIDFAPFTSFYTWVGDLDQQYGDNSVLNWILRFLLVGGPLVIIGLNMLAILHTEYIGKTRELILTIKLRTQNLIWIGISLGVFLVFFGYLILENL